MMRTARIVATFWIGLSALAAAAGPCWADKLAIGYIPSGDFLPAFVASEKGFFKQVGLDAQLVAVPLASNMPAALVAESVQIAMTTTPIMFQARENGIDLVAISGLSWDRRSNPQLSLVVRDKGPIKTAKDLAGKKVAFPGLKSLFDSTLTLWLAQNGVEPKQVSFIEAQMPQLADLLKSGNVDAIAVLDPFRAKALGDGAVKLADYLVDLRDNQPLAFWMATRAYAQTHPDDVKSFKAAIEMGLDFIAKNPDEARQIGAKFLRGNVIAIFPNWSANISAADMKFQTDMEHEVGVLQDVADVGAGFLH